MLMISRSWNHNFEHRSFLKRNYICLPKSNIDGDIFCISGDVPRVNGQLAVSRAFGDKSLKSHLRSDPDVQFTDMDVDIDILILASDGLWKVNHCKSKHLFPKKK